MSIVATESTRIIEPTTGALAHLADQLRERRKIQADHRVAMNALAWTENDQVRVPGLGDLDITDTAFRQLCGKLQLPADYLARIEPDLRAANISRAIAGRASDLLVRTEGNRVRGLLGPRYAAVNNLDIVDGLLARDSRALARYELTESALDIQIVGGSQARDVRTDSALKSGLHIRNSEVGLSKLNIEGFVLRTICLNGMVLRGSSGTFSRVHVGDGDDILRQALESLNVLGSHAGEAARRFGQAYEISIGGIDKGAEVIKRIGDHYDLTRPQVAASIDGFNTEPGDRLYHVLQGLAHAGTHSSLAQDARLQLQTVAGTVLNSIEHGHRWLN